MVKWDEFRIHQNIAVSMKLRMELKMILSHGPRAGFSVNVNLEREGEMSRVLDSPENDDDTKIYLN